MHTYLSHNFLYKESGKVLIRPGTLAPYELPPDTYAKNA